MKLVFCLTVAVLVVLSCTGIEVDGACSRRLKNQRKQKAASISENHPNKQPRFSTNPKANRAKAARAFGSAPSGGRRRGGGGRDAIFGGGQVFRSRNRGPARLIPVDGTDGGRFPAQSASIPRGGSALAKKLRSKVDSKRTRIFQTGSGSYPMQQIQSCCEQVDGYIEGFGTGSSTCYIIYPTLPRSVQCSYEDCYEGYWWDNKVGICVEQNPRSNLVILYCPFQYPYFILDKVTSYCNCGCQTC